MMELVKSDCGFEADIAIIELLQRFSECRRSDFATTCGWLDQHQDLWNRINKIDPSSEKIWISRTNKATEDSMPELLSFATQGKPKSAKSKTSTKYSTPHYMKLDCGCVIKPVSPDASFGGLLAPPFRKEAWVSQDSQPGANCPP
ncbi:hypothetical protein E4U16_001498 [Claviceps sp. LM84 group G4]|nr:hypothetical protein E4U33_000715 [Claviceps sp. LM78 group G4]KAG6078732.1 hypothetical protein E4U16_001498 [Claviceps sp. LM84 group G4]